MSLVLDVYLILLLMCVPKNLKESVMVIGLPFICMGVLGNGLRLKSIMSSWFWAVLSWRSLFEHHVTAWCKGVKGEEPRGENTALRSSCTEGERV